MLENDGGDGQADSRLDSRRWSKRRDIQAASVGSSACEMFYHLPIDKYGYSRAFRVLSKPRGRVIERERFDGNSLADTEDRNDHVALQHFNTLRQVEWTYLMWCHCSGMKF